MKSIFGFCLLAISLFGCNKSKENTSNIGCDIQKAYSDNAKKVTITNGVWGTIASMEGDCMPTVQPYANTCSTCPVQRTVKIYQYTLFSNATPSGNSTVFFDSFNTQLVAEAKADVNGFYQVNLPPGKYTLGIVENGKLYANGGDGLGGLNPFTLSGGTENVNVTMTYKAVF